MPPANHIPQSKPPKLDLPFGRGPEDPGAWAYDHRVGLCITVIVYLLAAIVFMSARIAIGQKQAPAGFYIDLQDERETRPKTEQERLLMMQGRELTDVRNLASNENAAQQAAGQQLNANIRDEKGTNAQQIYDEAAAAQARMAANREAYEAGLRQVEDISKGGAETDAGTSRSGDRKVEGNVTVSFSLVKPLRTSAYLDVPAYLCEGGGELVVAITVNRNGDVTAASVTQASASVDECMRSAATAAARRSRFNVDGSAPDKQQGTITYIFVPQ
ncbi:MAG: energy transducer TonB [Rikenellaceae bacterium]|jgi:TonB family protein|nr:energy transducer TonB [Rikenellaceae bacterium]